MPLPVNTLRVGDSTCNSIDGKPEVHQCVHYLLTGLTWPDLLYIPADLLVFIHLSGHVLLIANSHKVNLGKQVYLTRCLRLSYGSNSKNLGFQSPPGSIKECETLE